MLAGGYYESTYSLLAAAVLLALALAAALGAATRPSGAVLALGAFAVLSALSGVWGQEGAALRTAPLPLLYGAVLWAAEGAERRALLGALRAAILAAAVAGIVSYRGGRLDWPVTYANGLGLVCVTGVLLWLGLPSSRPRAARTAAAICALAAVLTFSRSALLAGAAGLVLLAARSGSIRVPRGVVAGGVALLLALGIALAQPVAARFAAPAPDEQDARRLLDVSGHGRTTLWRLAWEEGRAHPLAGGGAGTWSRYALEREAGRPLPANAHSLELETFAELGLAGLALLAVFLVLLVRRAASEPAALAIVLVWAAVSATDWDWQLPAATLPALYAAAGPRPALRPGPSLAAAAAALVLGVLAGLHGIGAYLVEEGIDTRSRARLAAHLLPGDARSWAALDVPRACRIDSGEPVLRRRC